MKAKKILIMLTTAAIIAMGSLASAQDNNAGTETEAEESISQVQIHGVVQKTDDRVTLFDGQTTYLLKSEKNLDSFAGKTVTVTGDGYTSDDGMVLHVKEITEYND